MLDRLVHNISIDWDDETFTYSSLCAGWEGECYENDIIELEESIDDIEAGKIVVQWPLFLTQSSFKSLPLPFIFGGVQLGNLSKVEFVKALQLNYFLAVNTKKQDQR